MFFFRIDILQNYMERLEILYWVDSPCLVKAHVTSIMHASCCNGLCLSHVLVKFIHRAHYTTLAGLFKYARVASGWWLFFVILGEQDRGSEWACDPLHPVISGYFCPSFCVLFSYSIFILSSLALSPPHLDKRKIHSILMMMMRKERKL